ncbi:MAG: hypothetical protein U1F17_06220 [Burkholderiaceae bacterium]
MFAFSAMTIFLVLPPETRFPGRSSAAQSRTDHEDVDAVFDVGDRHQ